MKARTLATWILCLAASLTCFSGSQTAHAQNQVNPLGLDVVYGYAHFYSLSAEGPIYFYVYFENCGTKPSSRTLTRVICNFWDCPVYLDCSDGWPELGASGKVKDVSFLRHLSDPQVFGVSAVGFMSRGFVIYELDLARTPTGGGNPVFEDYQDGTILFEFSDGTWVVAPFDQPSEWGRWGAKTDFYQLVTSRRSKS